jgi:hypothetical protein
MASDIIERDVFLSFHATLCCLLRRVHIVQTARGADDVAARGADVGAALRADMPGLFRRAYENPAVAGVTLRVNLEKQL